MSDQITYDDKADLIVDTTIDDMFKVSASDMNEIKKVVNSHADNIDVANNNITDLNNNKLDINAVLNQASTDTDKPYSADYLNDKLVSVGTTAPTDGRRVWFEKGKNLFNKDTITNGYRLDESGIPSSASNEFISDFISVKPSTQYVRNYGGTSPYTRTCFYDSSKTFISKDDEHQTFTTPNNARFLRFSEYTTNLNEMQVEEGSTATTYEPYVEPSINVDEELWYKKGGFVDISDTEPTNNASLWVQPTSENLIDYRNFQTKTSNGINIINNHDGTFTINGTASGDVSEVVSDVFIPMSGTWRMLGCPSGGSSSTYMLSAYVGYWGGGSPNIDTGSGTNITYTGNVKVRFYIKNGTTCNNLVFKPMLTTNTSATINNFAPKGPNLYALINGQYQIV